MSTSNNNSKRSPLIIGGVGGSGTRVFRAISVVAGYPMLSAPWIVEKLWKKHHDNLLMMKFFYPKWTGSYLNGSADTRKMRNQCRRLLWCCSPKNFERGRWGWKNPNTIHFLPFWKEIYPDLIYIHVVRDGRDIAFNKRMKYINPYNRSLFTAEEIALPEHLRKAKFWERCTERVKDWREGIRTDSFFETRFEQLCENTEGEIKRIFDFLKFDASQEQISSAAKLVRIPESLGRWKNAPLNEIEEVEKLIGESLNSFGYELSR